MLDKFPMNEASLSMWALLVRLAGTGFRVDMAKKQPMHSSLSQGLLLKVTSRMRLTLLEGEQK